VRLAALTVLWKCGENYVQLSVAIYVIIRSSFFVGDGLIAVVICAAPVSTPALHMHLFAENILIPGGCVIFF